jgi:hypothetical protein
MSEPELKLMVGRSHIQLVDFYAFLFVEERVENRYILSETQGQTSGTTVYDCP